MRVAVIGAGAIGGPIAAHMAEQNIDITIVTKHPELAEVIKTQGLRLTGVEKERSVPINAVPSITDLKEHYNIVFLATKGNDVEAAVKALLPS